jgi:hypothetical protein
MVEQIVGALNKSWAGGHITVSRARNLPADFLSLESEMLRLRQLEDENR